MAITDKAVEARRAYKREWARNNPEKVRAYQKKFWEKKAEEQKIKGQQTTASPEEAAERMAELRTQGRKGCKAVRINMAFTPDNHGFIKKMARISGMTMTEFTNSIIERYRVDQNGG